MKICQTIYDPLDHQFSSVQSLCRVRLFVTPLDHTVHEILQGRILAWVAFPFSRASSQPRDQTQVSHNCRWILYQLSHKGSPRIMEWVTYPFSSGSSQPRNWTRVSCTAGRFFTSWAIRKALMGGFNPILKMRKEKLKLADLLTW